MLDKKELLEELEREFNINKLRIEMATGIAEAITPSLPEGWEARYVEKWAGLMLSTNYMSEDDLKKEKEKEKEKDSDPRTEFKLVCSLVNQACNIKLEREPWMEGEKLYCLHGSGNLPFKDSSGREQRLKIEVRQFNTSKCDLVYEEVTVQKASLSKECLETVSN